jgi:parallel beta-helix repeat protein
MPLTQLPTDGFTDPAGPARQRNGTNPGGQQILVGRRANAFKVRKSWVTIDGFDIRHTDDASINLSGSCTDMVISNNHVSQSNTFGIRLVTCQRIRIDGNSVSDGQYHGIGLTTNTTGCVIRKNESFRNADPVARRAVGIYLFGSPNNILEANKTWGNQDTGIQFDAGSNACIAYNNRSYGNGDPGFDHLDATNTSHINDVAYHNFKDGFSIEGTSPGTQVFNCIAVDNGITTNEYDLWVNGPSSVGFRRLQPVLNSNEMFLIKIGANRYWRLLEYQAATGQDPLDQANPVHEPRRRQLQPLPGSPAIDAGIGDRQPAVDRRSRPRALRCRHGAEQGRRAGQVL